MTHEMAVWLFAQQVGMLSLASGRLIFQYGAEWLRQPHALALSQSLPLQIEPFDDHQCRPFFSGLLPEGHLRKFFMWVLAASCWWPATTAGQVMMAGLSVSTRKIFARPWAWCPR